MIWTVEIESPVPAAQMFEAAIINWHQLGPEILPKVLESASEEGMVRQLNFASGVMPFNSVKEFMNHVDFHDLECVLTTMEGGLMETKFKLEFTRYKIEPASDNSGCVVKVETTTELVRGVEEVDLEGDIDKIKEAAVKQFKAVEAYLLAHPEEFRVVRTRGEEAPPRDRGFGGWMLRAGVVSGVSAVVGSGLRYVMERYIPSTASQPQQWPYGRRPY